MKKLIFLSLTLFAAPLGAMEGQSTKEKEQEKPAPAEPKQIPSLAELCARKVIKHAESFENPEKILEQIPYLPVNIAWDIIMRFPEKIIKANTEILKKQLLSKDVNAVVKTAIVEKADFIIEPTEAQNLFDSALALENINYQDQYRLAHTLFKHYIRLQSLHNLLLLTHYDPASGQLALSDMQHEINYYWLYQGYALVQGEEFFTKSKKLLNQQERYQACQHIMHFLQKMNLEPNSSLSSLLTGLRAGIRLSKKSY